MTSQPASTSSVISALRQQIRKIEGYKAIQDDACLRLGVEAIDSMLPGNGLPLGTTHEFISPNEESAASTSAFVLATLSRLKDSQGTIVWVTKSRWLYPAGLLQFGINPSRIVFVTVNKDKDALWAIEEVLRCKNVLAVVGEISDADLKATRRFQLAVEASGVTGFLIRIHAKKQNLSACNTRWVISPHTSINHDGLPGVGIPRWHIELIKVKHGQTGSWVLEWEQGFRLASSSNVKENGQDVKQQFG